MSADNGTITKIVFRAIHSNEVTIYRSFSMKSLFSRQLHAIHCPPPWWPARWQVARGSQVGERTAHAPIGILSLRLRTCQLLALPCKCLTSPLPPGRKEGGRSSCRYHSITANFHSRRPAG